MGLRLVNCITMKCISEMSWYFLGDFKTQPNQYSKGYYSNLYFLINSQLCLRLLWFISIITTISIERNLFWYFRLLSC